MDKCIQTKTVIHCNMRPCCEAQEVSCCWQCKFHQTCESRCKRFSKKKEDKNEKGLHD